MVYNGKSMEGYDPGIRKGMQVLRFFREGPFKVLKDCKIALNVRARDTTDTLVIRIYIYR